MIFGDAETKKLLKGRTAEQKKVILYFQGGGGCLNPAMKDEEFDAMVNALPETSDFRKKALAKIGLDEEEVNEIEPVHFEGYLFDDRRAHAKAGDDRKWRSSMYQFSWLFFSATQVYVWQYTINLAEDGRKEATEEYFYKDITNFSTSSDTVEMKVLDKVSCTGNKKYVRTNVDSNRFTLVVPGEKFGCSMEQNDYTERAIQGMKAKLREKKA